MSSLNPYPINPALTAIAVAYSNEKMIADAVLPRTPVGKQVFKYKKFSLGDAFTVPNTLVGRKGQPNEIEFGATDATAQTRDYGLDTLINNEDIENQQGLGLGFDPLSRATELLTDLVMLDREIRVANLVFNTGSYAAGNQSTLAGATQWSDPTSDPIKAIALARDGMLMRPNVLVLGRAVATQLSMHPKVISAAYPLGGNANAGNNAGAIVSAGGKVPMARLAELLELDEVIIGEGWVNTAKPGQAVSLTRVWGKHAALMVRGRQVDTVGSITFGYTAQWGTRLAGTLPEPKVGLRGAQRVRSGESLLELLVANDLGYFFQNAVA
jgi:hypothetical protein